MCEKKLINIGLDICPVVNTDQLVVELKKVHSECLIQVLIFF